jgi:hypothetical protein
MHLKGRHWLMFWLLVFLCVLLAITTRQTAGFRTARRLHDLREERLTLEARRADLERRIRLASSRQVLVPMVQRELGLHEPADSEFVLFVLPPAGPEAR